MTSTFLILDLALFLLPFLFFLDQKHFGFDFIKASILPSLVVTIVFSEVAVFFTSNQVWQFNPIYHTQIAYRQLPLEAYLFIFTFSFAGLGIYNYLNAKFPKNELQKYSLAISNLLLGILIAVLFFARAQWFPLISVVILFLLLFGVEYVNRLRFMYKFYRAFAACLIPFYLTFGVLCNLPMISYKQTETMGLNLAKIPFESHFFMMGMLLLGVYVLEYFKDRAANK